jgi:hypothetical protein
MNHTGIHCQKQKKNKQKQKQNKTKPNVSIWKRSQNPILYEEIIIKPKWIDGSEN